MTISGIAENFYYKSHPNQVKRFLCHMTFMGKAKIKKEKIILIYYYIHLKFSLFLLSKFLKTLKIIDKKFFFLINQSSMDSEVIISLLNELKLFFFFLINPI